MKTNDQITIYFKGSLGIGVNKIEGKLVNIGTKQYAQYNKAPFVDIIPKGKRKTVRYIQTYNPYMLILQGINHPNTDRGMINVSTSDEVTVQKSKYSSFDDRYLTEFDSVIDKYISQNNINNEDFRSTKGFSSY